MKVTWLHISDFHIRDGDSYDRDVVLGALVRSVREMGVRQGRRPDLIFATGDIAHAGKASQYKQATKFFDALLDATGLDRSRLFVIPGNHDIDRDQGRWLARTLDSREEADAYFAPGAPKPHLQKLGAYRDWYNEYFKGIRQLPPLATCVPVEVADIRGVRVAVMALNSALFCQDDEDDGKLVLGRRCLGDAIAELNRREAAPPRSRPRTYGRLFEHRLTPPTGLQRRQTPMTRFHLDHAIAVLERTPASLTALLIGLPDPWITATEGPNTWSPYDVIGHLIHGERTDWIPRVRHILAGETRPFEPFDRTAQFTESQGKSLSDLLHTFADLRRDSLNTLRAMDLAPADLSRSGLHPVLGAVTLGQLLATWVVHDLDHIGQIARTMAKAHTDEVGPWSAYLSILHDRT
jgi:hypothetical protein